MRHIDTNTYCYRHCNSDHDPYAETNTYTKNSPDPEESTNAQAAPVVRAAVSNQSMKPTAPFRCTFSVFATTPCRGLSPSR